MIESLKKSLKKILIDEEVINSFRYYFKEIEFETTIYCNRRCVYCPQSLISRVGDEEGKYMRREVFEKLISDLKSIHFKGMMAPHLYGEPMSDPRLLEWVVYMRRELPFCTIKIVTNGDYLSRDKYHEFIKAGVDFFNISKHGEKLSKGAQEIVQDLSPAERKKRFHILDYYEDYRAEQKMLTSRGGVITLKKELRHPQYCIYVTYPVVDTFGNVILCCNDYHGRYVSGNIMKKSLVEIWRDPKNIELRKKIYKGIFDLPICKNCWM